ncbi:MAG: hypothetical protein WC478_01785 [Candidatus Omnitrophota bacterium]
MRIINSGAKRKDKYLGDERRWYIRLDTVLPVQFRLVGLDNQTSLSPNLQGFTNNLSKGGICLCAPELPQGLARLLREHQARVILSIDVPFLRKPIDAESTAIWVREDPAAPCKYYLGLAYEKIDPAANNRLMRYARGKQLFIPVVLLAVVLLGMALALNGFLNIRLTEGNRQLIRQLSAVIRESNSTKQKISEISREKETLGARLGELTARIQAIEEEKAGLSGLKGKAAAEITVKSRKINELNTLLQQLVREKGRLKQQLAGAQAQERAIAGQLARIDEKKQTLEKANFDRMYDWIKIHQNLRTGLVMSFEGDSDIDGWAFTYDESLAIQAFAYFGDNERARKALDFFKNRAERKNGLFLNAYYAHDGLPAEFIVHSGPNIWLGIAALQYTQMTKDRQYLGLAEDIAAGIISLQKEDAEGGLRGGPAVTWYATEHNLDAYAFFDMLFTLANKQKYAEARDKALDWLVKNTYNKSGVPIKRGKGDATIATDTYAWSIAAVGPDKLESLGMHPDKIMEFAENTCRVDVPYNIEDRVVRVQGFDFAPQRHLARGGVVSSEWTAQMAISFKMMADHYLKKNLPVKAGVYRQKADECLASLSSMIICSPSASGQGANCLPYASQDFVDTGHGWFTPKGKSTGSVSGTAYTIFAYYNYNPLKLKD